MLQSHGHRYDRESAGLMSDYPIFARVFLACRREEPFAQNIITAPSGKMQKKQLMKISDGQFREDGLYGGPGERYGSC